MRVGLSQLPIFRLARFLGYIIPQKIQKSIGIFKNEKTTKPNAALFECIMLSFEDFSLDELKSKKESIKHLVRSLLSDADFEKSIDKATGNTEVINLRLSTFRTRLGDLMRNAG